MFAFLAVLKDYAHLVRPHHWLKNLFCFGGLFFGGRLLEREALFRALLVFGIFCLISSAVYIFNDIHDREADARHPRKKYRPLARGTVSPQSAAVFAAIFALLGFGAVPALGPGAPAVLVVTGLYILLNVAYTLWLKRIPLLDVNIIALGFLLRVAAGAFAVAVVPTHWILLCTYFLALLLAFGKRRAELCVTGTVDMTAGASPHGGSRTALRGYSRGVLDACLLVCAGLVIVTYSLYCFLSHEKIAVTLTIVPVVVGIIRYLQITREGNRGERPEMILLTDRLIQVDTLVWAGLFAYALYGTAVF